MKKITKSLLAVVITSSLLCLTVLIPITANAAGPSLPNPISGEDGEPANITAILLRVMQIALAVVDIFALFMFILGGFEFLISAGNPTMIKKAKDTLVWATLGILVITLSYSVLKFVFEEVSKGFG